jgi:uncharacterized membrane protein YgcG
MRGKLFGIAIAVLGITAGLFGIGPVALAGSAPPAHASVDDFSYDGWRVEYRIGTDDEGRAIARVTETLTARFPDFDQNRGLVRGLPIDYEGSSTDPRDFSVTDAAGEPVPFDVERDDGFVAVLTGDDRYVHGVQTYVIEYTLSDVVLARDDGKADEFYWDLTDFEHRQPINGFSAQISFSPELAEHLNGDARCYSGAAHSTQECAISEAGGEFSVSVAALDPREGVTVAIGLEPGSVAQPPERLPNFALDTLPFAGGAAALGVGVAGLVSVLSLRRKHRTARGTIVAQYDVPNYLPPLVAAPIVGSTSNPASAQLVHLAVNGTLRIEDGVAEQGLFGPKQPQPVLRLVDPGRAGAPVDREAMLQLFPQAAPGAAFTIPKQSESFASKMRKLQSSGVEQARSRGYFQRLHSPAARALGIVGIVVSAGLLVLSLVGIAQRGSVAGLVGLVAGGIALVLSIIAVCPQRVHTPAGAETREYLEGVREFIRVAEADRIRMLQSYSGAERQQDGSVDVIHLYEKLLPYAMLFGLEKQWTRTLAVRYEQSPGYVPYWYPAVAMHGLGAFDSTISQFTSSLNSSVSYTSSSSGGSSGGGFSGGGGGGGFSGGR